MNNKNSYEKKMEAANRELDAVKEIIKNPERASEIIQESQTRKSKK